MGGREGEGKSFHFLLFCFSVGLVPILVECLQHEQ